MSRSPPESGTPAGAAPAASGTEPTAGDGRTAVVIVDHGSRRAQSNAMLSEFVEVFKRETGHVLVEAAHMELAKPSIADAFASCARQGASFVIVSPFFLGAGRHWTEDIPALCAAAAAPHPGLQYMVAAPIGAHPLVARVLQERIQQCMGRRFGGGSACEACRGSSVGCLGSSPVEAQELEALDGVQRAT